MVVTQSLWDIEGDRNGVIEFILVEARENIPRLVTSGRGSNYPEKAKSMGRHSISDRFQSRIVNGSRIAEDRIEL